MAIRTRTAGAPAPSAVVYYRVSTERQGRSGLGLEAQQAAVEGYLRATPGLSVAASFREVETGKRNDRPELARAIERCSRTGARLVIAKLDRLARNARFLLGIVESGVDVVFCDLPTVPPGPVGKFLVTQMAAVAELEAGLISERTRAALAAYKARGGKLGAARPECRRLSDDDRRRGARTTADANRAGALEADAELAPRLLEMEQSGMGLRAIARELTAIGVETRHGGAWNHGQVARILDRAYGKERARAETAGAVPA